MTSTHEASLPLTLEEQGAIHIVRMNRPERLNALDESLVNALLDYFVTRRRDRGTRVILLTGSGRGFCSGADLKTIRFDSAPDGLLDGDWPIREVIAAMRDCPQPIVSLVNGPAVGAGLALVLASDIIVAGDSATFFTGFSKVGLSGSELGVAWRLQRAVSPALAREMCLTNRKLSAAEALAAGLVSKIAPGDGLVAEGLAIADAMLGAAPDALRLTKKTLDTAMESGLGAVLESEERAQMLMLARTRLRVS